MANFWYGKGVYHFANGDVSWGSNTINVALVSATYTAAQNTDEFYSVAVVSGAIVSAGVTLGTNTNTLGKLSAANSTWSSVSGSQVTQLVGYVNGTAGSGDYLLFNLNTGTNLPVTPNGGNITSTWDPTNGIGTLMAGLNQGDRVAWQRLRDWLRDVFRNPFRDDRSGLWLPSPTLILEK